MNFDKLIENPFFSKRRQYRFLIFAALLLTCTFACQVFSQTPENLKIAFIGDQGLGEKAKAVLRLIKNEGTDAVLHQGDLDYQGNPKAWDDQISDILGSNFPYFVSIGNHDRKKWEVVGGYQEVLQNRMNRIGVTWDGQLGVQSSLNYKGVLMILVGPGVIGSGSDHAEYIKQMLAEDNSIWRISSWHNLQGDMQVGAKGNQIGWRIYEESRKGGAIIATAHSHTYSRTYLLSNMENQTIVNKSNVLNLTKGHSFAFVSGIGGHSIRDQKRDGDWWASIYTSTQNANYGALFGTFNFNGQKNVAEFYFKDIDGNIPDKFLVVSHLGGDVVADNKAPAPPKKVIVEKK